MSLDVCVDDWWIERREDEDEERTNLEIIGDDTILGSRDRVREKDCDIAQTHDLTIHDSGASASGLRAAPEQEDQEEEDREAEEHRGTPPTALRA